MLLLITCAESTSGDGEAASSSNNLQSLRKHPIYCPDTIDRASHQRSFNYYCLPIPLSANGGYAPRSSKGAP